MSIIGIQATPDLGGGDGSCTRDLAIAALRQLLWEFRKTKLHAWIPLTSGKPEVPAAQGVANPADLLLEGFSHGAEPRKARFFAAKSRKKCAQMKKPLYLLILCTEKHDIP
jgi:hypothetical protein